LFRFNHIENFGKFARELDPNDFEKERLGDLEEILRDE